MHSQSKCVIKADNLPVIRIYSSGDDRLLTEKAGTVESLNNYYQIFSKE